MKLRPKSVAVYNEMCEQIPGGVNSPVRSCKSVGISPLVASSACQDRVFDEDGHSYVDYCGSWGALIHGHAHPKIVEAVQKRIEKGTSFGMTTALEGVMAKELIRLIDCVEKIRFVSSGTEATMSCARVARGFTHRDVIVKFSGNYHGHADFFLVKAGSGLLEVSQEASSAGVPKDMVKNTINLPYNDCRAVKELFAHPEYQGKIAAVILEPVAGNMGVVPATYDFIKCIRDETKKNGSLLIFDEVITGFRIGLEGASAHFGIQPDLVCFGKIIGGGFPLAAFGGKGEIMDVLAPLGAVYQAGTLSGNPVCVEAGLMSLQLLQEKGFYEELERKAHCLIEPIRKMIVEKQLNACVQQVGSMFTLFLGKRKVDNLDDAMEVNCDLYRKLFQFLFEAGIYVPPAQHEAWFVSQAHTEEHLKMTSEKIISFLEKHKSLLV